MSFTYPRTIHFRDTDAAGVVYFANVLSICHEAYEASLMMSGINLKDFFAHPKFALPIIHANIDFRRPMYCGEQYEVYVKPRSLSPNKLEISYSILLPQVPESVVTQAVTAQAVTVHLCIDPATRDRLDLPPEIERWLKLWSK
jgi:1,4-dihydroxy-2-naphthoyl-CoA hydrolase